MKNKAIITCLLFIFLDNIHAMKKKRDIIKEKEIEDIQLRVAKYNKIIHQLKNGNIQNKKQIICNIKTQFDYLSDMLGVKSPEKILRKKPELLTEQDTANMIEQYKNRKNTTSYSHNHIIHSEK